MNDQKIAILVDSCCDVPKKVIEKYNMFVLPVKIITGDEEYLDGVTITSSQVLDRMEKENFTTSLPDGAQVMNMFETIKQCGYEKVFAVTMSSQLSGTYNFLNLMGQECEDLEVFVLDSRNISIGSGLCAVLAANYIARGMSWEELIDTMPGQISRSKVFFCLDTLEYLRRGGRIGNVAAVLGSALNLKPIISCGADGVYHVVGKALGRAQSVKKVLELAAKFGGEDPCDIAVMDSRAAQEALVLKMQSLIKMPKSSIVAEGDISPALVVHTGPGLVGIGVLKK